MDATSGMIVEMLKQHIGAEPPKDMGMHPSEELHAEIGATWADWSKEKRALERILAPRLIRDALENVK